MDHNQMCSKSFSCESLFIERPSNKRKYLDITQSPQIVVPFKNDDYNYLFNCNELIKTCKEVLLENEQVISAAAKDLNGFLTSGSPAAHNKCDQKEKQLESESGEISDGGKLGSIVDFSKWLNLIEQQLNAVCYCSLVQSSPTNSEFSSSSSGSDSQKEWTDLVSQHKSIQSEVESVGRRFINAIKLNGNGISKSLLASEERRWHSLWLRSLEYLMILEECNKCPKHYSYRDSTADPLPTTPPKRHKLSFPTSSSTGASATLACSSSATSPSVFMKNRRIQTTMGSGNQTADRLDFRGAKFEIIQKDIGYSSDADMSDACEAHQCSEYINLSTRGNRKRHVRRRRSRISRRRPWSFHSDWTDWDYYQPPFCYSAEYKSSEDFNSYDDETVVRNLIEFGENYEFWIKNDDDAIMRASTPTHLELSSKDEEEEEEEEAVDSGCSSSRRMKLEKVHTAVEALIEEVDEGRGRVKREEKETETERSQIMGKTAVRKSRGGLSASFLVYFALSMFALAITALYSYFPPHVQKTYPSRPPPI